MNLVPAVAALLLFGVLPLGGPAVGLLGGLLPLPAPVATPAAWLLLFLGSFFGGRFVVGLLAERLPDDAPPHEDDPGETGTLRGQLPLGALVAATWVALGVAALHGVADAWRLGYVALCLGAAFSGASPRPARSPPPTPRPGDPRDPATPRVEVTEAEADVPPAERRVHSLQWRFSADGSDGTDEASMHGLTVVLRASRVEAARRAPHPEVGGKAGYGALATVVSEGLTPEVVRAGRALRARADEARLSYLDLVAYVLAFVRDGIASASDREAHNAESHTAFPLETLATRQGDATDRALLACALLRAAGVPAHLAVAELRAGGFHLGVAVPALADRALGDGQLVPIGGRAHLWCEPGTSGAVQVGEIPAELRSRLLRLVPVVVG